MHRQLRSNFELISRMISKTRLLSYIHNFGVRMLNASLLLPTVPRGQLIHFFLLPIFVHW